MQRSQYLKTYMLALADRGYFHGAVLVAERGNVLLAEGYGLANMEHGVTHTSQTKFRVGSITKPITAIALLQLQERGLLSLDDPIALYLPDYPQGERITIRHLLTHTSGIPSFTSRPDYWWKTMRLPHTPAELVASFQDLPLEFAPGTQFAYSNSGYLLLALILEKVAGCSYEEYIRRAICEPLQMQDTGVDDGMRLIERRASGYTMQKEFLHADWIDMSVTLGGYGLYSTVEDLYRLDRALYGDRLLSQASRDEMFTPFRDDYGLGWAVEDIWLAGDNRWCYSHFGDINGFCADWFRFVQEELTVIVLSNFNLTPVVRIGMDLAKIALGEPVEVLQQFEPLAVSETELWRCSGVYQSEEPGQQPIVLTVEKGRLLIEMSRQYGVRYVLPLQLVQREGDVWHGVTAAVDEQVWIHGVSNGEPSGLEYRNLRGQKYFFKKVQTTTAV